MNFKKGLHFSSHFLTFHLGIESRDLGAESPATLRLPFACQAQVLRRHPTDLLALACHRDRSS